MKAHELARKLLEGPNLPVIIGFGDLELGEVTKIARFPGGTYDFMDYWYDPDSKQHDDAAIELS